MKRSISIAVACFAALVLLSGGQDADAKKKKGGGSGPEKAFKGKILFSDKRFPMNARSPGAYTSKLRKQKKEKFWENKTKKGWKIYYAAFFNRPYNDLEVTVKMYDISDGRKQMLGSFEQYLDKRGERVIISYVEIERKYFGVNKRVLMQVEDYKGRVYAKGYFKILGEAERYSGQVSFTEEETKAGTNLDDDDE